jgi:TonB family protein
MSFQNRKSDPNSAFSDTLARIMTNYNPRIILPSPEYFDKTDIHKAYTIAADRFKDASDFTFVFIGNVDAQKMKPLIEKYIGSIPSINRKEIWKDLKVQPKKGKTIRSITAEMKEPKATVFVHYFGEYPCTPENVENLNAIKYILSMRFTETIREKEGGTYGVNVSNTLWSRPVNNYKFTMNFNCSPDKADYLKGLLYQEIQNIKENGVTAEELDKTKKYFLKSASENLKNNSFIMDRVKNCIVNGVYTPLPQYTTDIYTNLDASKIKKLAKDVFKDDVVELVMKPAGAKAAETKTEIKDTETKKVYEIDPAKNKPLVMLDGEEVSNEQYKSFNPGDCKSMLMLGPVASVAKYGDKGKNGVIIINKTTTDDSPVYYTDDAIFMKAEVMPEFPGGMKAMMDWMSTKLTYPEELKPKNIHGFVMINFLVNNQGKVVKTKVLKSLDPQLDQLALNTINQMPEWKPGTCNGKPVNVVFTLPVRF